jgi:hypothetical protein
VQLLATEIESVEILRKTTLEVSMERVSDLNESVSLAVRLEENRRKRQSQSPTNVKYMSPKFIPPTSNCCERFFSKAGYALNKKRRALLPVNLEAQLFLHVNHRYWNIHIFHEAVEDSKCESEDDPSDFESDDDDDNSS